MENLTKESFKEKVFDFEKNKEWKYVGKLPSIVDFYADWCGPCKTITPILQEISEKYKNKLNVYKVNTEEEIELISAFGIRSIPSLLFIPMEGEPQMKLGTLTMKNFENLINEILKIN